MPSRSNLLILVAMTLVVAAPAFAADPEPAKPAAETADRQTAADPTCLRDTGTRIKRPQGQCNAASGRVYGADDLRATGQPTVGEALRQIDPSIGTSPGR
jgi:hypothetical protein